MVHKEVLLKKDALGFIPTTDDDEESYLKRAERDEKFYSHMKSITESKSESMGDYFDGNLDALSFVETGRACKRVYDNFCYSPSLIPVIEFDGSVVMPKIDGYSGLSARVMAQDELNVAQTLSVPFEGSWSHVVYVSKGTWGKVKYVREEWLLHEYLLAHELVHACATSTFVKRDDFAGNENPQRLFESLKAEIFPWIVWMGYHFIHEITEGKKVDRETIDRLGEAIAGNAAKKEIEGIIECNDLPEFPLEDMSAIIPKVLNQKEYNKRSTMDSLFGTGWMWLDAVCMNPLAWWSEVLERGMATAGMRDDQSMMEGIIRNFFGARKRIEHAYSREAAKAIVGRATMEELEEICSHEGDAREFISSKAGFKWQLIREVCQNLKSPYAL